MSEHWTREERETLETLDQLASGARAKVGVGAEAQHDEELARQHRTLFALLAYENEPETPSPACRERLMGRITELAGGGESAARRRSVEDLTLAVMASPPQGLDKTLVHSSLRSDEVELAASSSQPEVEVHPALLSRQHTPRTPWWSLTLAALLGIAVVGLAFFYSQAAEERAVSVRLSADLQQSRARVETLEARSEELLAARRRLDMVTRVARQAYPMRPVARAAGSSQSSQAEGIIFVCGNHQQWYLSLHGLEPAPSGKQYVLWYVTEEGPVNAGVVTVAEADDPAELDAPTMPRGTHAFMVTLEQRGDQAVRPAGKTVVLGDQPVYL